MCSFAGCSGLACFAGWEVCLSCLSLIGPCVCLGCLAALGEWSVGPVGSCGCPSRLAALDWCVVLDWLGRACAVKPCVAPSDCATMTSRLGVHCSIQPRYTCTVEPSTAPPSHTTMMSKPEHTNSLRWL